MTRRTVLAAFAAVAALAPVSSVAAAPCATVVGAFRSTRYPQFPDEATPVHAAFAVSASDARRVYLASQKQLLQSTDGGCTWRSVFALSDSPTAEAPYRYSQMVVGGIETAPGKRVHLFLKELGGYVRPYVLTSADGSGGWVAATGLPPAGRVTTLEVAPSDPNVVYANVLTALTHLPTTYASNDGGKSFTRMTAPAVAAQSKAMFLSVDPVDAKRLWATGGGVTSTSTDGGATWTTVAALAGATSFVGVKGPKGATLVGIDGQNARVHRSDDGGTTWTTMVAPAGVNAAAFGATPKDLYLLSYANQKTDVWRFDGKTKRFARAATRLPHQTWFSMEPENGRRPAFWGYAPNTAIVRWAP